jgi:hypothetical protein
VVVQVEGKDAREDGGLTKEWKAAVPSLLYRCYSRGGEGEGSAPEGRREEG